MTKRWGWLLVKLHRLVSSRQYPAIVAHYILTVLVNRFRCIQHNKKLLLSCKISRKIKLIWLYNQLIMTILVPFLRPTSLQTIDQKPWVLLTVEKVEEAKGSVNESQTWLITSRRRTSSQLALLWILLIWGSRTQATAICNITNKLPTPCCNLML